MNSLQQQTLTIAMLAGSLLFVRCSNTPAEQKLETDKKLDKIEDKMMDANTATTQAAWETERADILKDLRDLRLNIENKISETDVKLADKKLKPSERNDAAAFKAELQKEKSAVDDLIAKAENATDATWSSAKIDLKKGADDVKGWWARLKDNIDKKTDADHDKDGH